MNAQPQVAVLLYPGCIFFEVALALEALSGHCGLHFFTPDGQPHAASNGSRLLVDGDYAALAVLAREGAVQAVLVPGGDPGSIVPDQLATPALQAAAAQGALMAGICAGNLVLASAGLLKGVRATHNYTVALAGPQKAAFTASFWEGVLVEEGANVVCSGQFITAMPWAHVAFAAEVAQRLKTMNAAEAQAFIARHQRHS